AGNSSSCARRSKAARTSKTVSSDDSLMDVEQQVEDGGSDDGRGATQLRGISASCVGLGGRACGSGMRGELGNFSGGISERGEDE
ncbi:Unknown protein, partial [Striga hermonthica]